MVNKHFNLGQFQMYFLRGETRIENQDFLKPFSKKHGGMKKKNNIKSQRKEGGLKERV